MRQCLNVIIAIEYMYIKFGKNKFFNIDLF